MKKSIDIMEKISFVLLCVLMVDCSILGFSAWGQFGPIASRMFTMLLAILFAIPSLLVNFKKIVSNKYFVSVMAFAIILGIAAIIGIFNEHRFTLILRDIKGFSCFVILPVVLLVLNCKERVLCLMKCLMAGATAAGIYSIVSLIIFLNDKDLFNQMAIEYKSTLFAYYAYISDSIARLFYQSSVYLLCGCAFAIYFYITEKKKHRWIYPIIVGICLFAALVTYTRSLYLAAFLTAVLLVVFFLIIGKKEEKKDLFKCIGLSVIIFCVIVTTFGVAAKTDYVRFAILRTTSGMGNGEGVDEDSTEITGEEEYLQLTEESDSLREATLNGLYRNIKKSPIIGIGLGAEFKERPEGVNEYVYLDMISKMGIIGLLVYFIPFIIMTKRLWDIKKGITMKNAFPVLFMFILSGYIVFSHFNPYMSGALGIFFYCCTIGSINWLEKELDDKRKSIG